MKFNKKYIPGLFIGPIGLAVIFFFADGFTVNGLLKGFELGVLTLSSFLIMGLLLVLLGPKINKIKNSLQEELKNDSTLIYAGMVSYSKGSSRISGIMRLTGETLYIRTNRPEETPYFRTNRFDIEEQETFIPIDTIAILKKHNEMFFIPTGMIIVTTDGSKRKFTLDDRDMWFEKITEAMEKHKCYPD